jgi:dTDP-4-amino-4,6-dideoxygalactose transaminase
VEDAAQGHGARWRGTPLGAHGRLGVLSFGRGKGWTGASGGAVLVRDPRDVDEGLGAGLAPPASRACILMNAAAHWSLGRPSIYGLPRAVPGLGLGETRYRPVCMPRAMSLAAAALALDGKVVADAWVGSRRAAAARYEKLLAEGGVGNVPTRPAQSECGFGRFPVILPRGMESFLDASAALRLGAAPGYPRPLPELDSLLPLLSDRGARWPGADLLVRELVTLPTHPLASPAERDRLVRLLRAGAD